jgi:hypothetical protein
MTHSPAPPIPPVFAVSLGAGAVGTAGAALGAGAVGTTRPAPSSARRGAEGKRGVFLVGSVEGPGGSEPRPGAASAAVVAAVDPEHGWKRGGVVLGATSPVGSPSGSRPVANHCGGSPVCSCADRIGSPDLD